MDHESYQDLFQESFIWVKRWAAAFGMADDLLDLNLLFADQQTSREQVLARIVSLHEKINADSIELERSLTSLTEPSQSQNLSPMQKQLKQVASEMLLFSAQHLAFLLDSLDKDRRYYFHFAQSTPQFDNRNAFQARRVSNLLVELGSVDDIDYPLTDYALRRVVNQISSDVLLLHRIWNQYKEDAPLPAQTTISQANSLAKRTWSVFKEYLPETEAPLTYVKESANVRLIPYSTIPLIAIPASALTIPGDLLAIPHEFGHFLFWRGHFDNNPLDTIQNWLWERLRTQKAPLWKRGWLEEVFADVTGTLIGGPLAAFSLQDMMLEKVGDLFRSVDDHYPIPALRPFTAIAVLEHMGLQKIAKDLQTRWESALNHRLKANEDRTWLLDTATSVDESPKYCEVNLSKIEQELKELGTEVANLFIEDGWELTNTWWNDGDLEDSVKSLREKLQAFRPDSSQLQQVDAEQVVADQNRITWLDAVSPYLGKQVHGQLQKLSEQSPPYDWILTVLDDQINTDRSNAIFISPQEWFAVLYLGGWGDAGPTGGSPHVT